MHPILWRWGPITLHSYGVLLALAVFAGIRMAGDRARRLGVDPTRVVDACCWILLGGLVGARAVYVAQQWPIYAADPLEILRLDHGGLVFYGGLLGGAIVAVPVLRRLPVSPWAAADLLIPSVALAQAIGRIGCFLNGCCYGAPTAAPWAVRFPHDAVARHPTQLYESAALFLLTAILLGRARRPSPPGALVGWYLIGYGVWRFLVEFLRGDNPPWLGSLTFSQVVSIPLVVAGAWIIRQCRQKSVDTRLRHGTPHDPRSP